MKSLRTISSAFLIFSFLISIVHAEPRTALLMGVGDYKDTRFPSLPGIDQDLKRMKTALEKTGFEVTVLANPNITEATKAVDAFGATLKQQKGVGLFYFSGHGGELEGQNYLIPKGARISDNQDIRIQALAARRVLSRMESSGARVNLMFLDACRNDMTKASTQSGLAPMNVKGTFIGFATGTDKLANAGQQGSPYTSVLADMITRPGLSVSDMHTLVNARVQEDTKDAPTGQQVPFQYSGLNSLFYFVPGAPVRPIPAAPAPQIAATKEKPFSNSLGMKFVPAGTPGVFFSVWEARVGDFRKFVTETDYDAIESSTNGDHSFTLEEGGEWKQAGGSWKNPRFPASAKQNDEHPVVCVSYLDAESFCAWLTKKERASGRIPANASYRLPTDGEWSRACGLGKYPWGNTFPPKRNEGNYSGKETMIGSLKGLTNELSKAGRADGAGRTSAVGMYGANRYGLHDMGGNVFEWCGTWYRASLNEADVLEKIPALKDDKGGETYRVLRGGSWLGSAGIPLRSSFRNINTPRNRYDYYGFRCVLSVG